jgi:uncharacterized membrane protein
MNERTIYIMNFVAILGTGMVAGVFLAFSSFVMEGLSRLPVVQGMAAMQQINITVINPLFMGVLFGTALLCAALVFAAWHIGFMPANQLMLLGALMYLLGAIGITMVFNVPLNDGLAAANEQSSESAALWVGYVKNWTFWNSARGIAALVSCALFVRSLTLLSN